ncbi:hypothetical protein [Sanguibacter sp. HDW7]|uniref:hypothetical protein n=1 Tax=Sanguibacter sp. HDW7 TaxID=2714931 RepID=UPI00140A461A|nr:hypothetical protein [Sanguibacter sp. HDW7]QIK83836.1 hypothetical protein G7063_09520 [Sanguibacter sp. HDW7]
MTRTRSALLSSALALALAATVAPAASGATVASASATSAQVAEVVPSTRSNAGGITVVTDADGAFVSWTAPVGDRLTDARTQFRLPDGRVVLPTATGRSYSARVLGATDLRASQVAVVRGGRVLAGASEGVAGQTAPTSPGVLASRPSALVSKDPGKAGKYATRSFTYSSTGMKVPGYAAPVETRAHVVMPRDAKGARPVVVMLHGRHSVCYSGNGIVDDWPCAPGTKAIPSYLGYLDQQKLLASQGYVTVSIAANGINAQDFSEADGGAGTRANLVRRHLSFLASWNRGTKGPRGTELLKGRLNLSRVVTMGHSRGGEGVSRAAIKARVGDPFKIVGQVLIAPTDFATQVAVGIPTTVLLPSCDGDVSDLQGQAYVDRAVGIMPGDHAMRSSVLVLGANHNFFNSEWTPGISKAPSIDDGDASGTCGTSAKGRLTAKQQRAVGATYVAAAVKAYLTGDDSARQLLDGSAVRAASAGAATVLSHAVGARRTPVLTADRPAKVSTRGSATAVSCAVVAREESTQECFGNQASPHNGGLYGTTMPADPALLVRWTAKDARVRLTGLPDLSNRSALAMRVVLPSQRTTPSFDLVLTDTKGRSAVVKADRAPERLPSIARVGQAWAQEVRFSLPARSVVDTSRLARVDLRTRSAAGKIVVLDMHGFSSGLIRSSASVNTVARVSVPARTKITAAGSGSQVLRIPVTGSRKVTARVWVERLDLRSWKSVGEFRTIKPGQTSIDVRYTLAEDDAVSVSPEGVELGLVTVIADRGAVVDQPAGVAWTPPGVAPKVSVVDPVATASPGGSLRWELRLSGPTIEGSWLPLTFTPVAGELRAEQLVPAWLAPRFGSTELSGPLSSSLGGITTTVEPGATSVIFEIPVRRTADVAPRRSVRIVVDRSASGEPDLVLTGTVTP